MKKSRWLVYGLPLVIFILLATGLWAGLSTNPRFMPSALINRPAPVLAANNLLSGVHEQTPMSFGNKIALLNVWATWCVPCKQEHPVLMAISKHEDIMLYGLNYKDNLEEARNFLRQFGNPYITSWQDPQGKIGLEWGVYGVPETFLIDKKGVIRYRYTGPLTIEVFKQEFKPRIEELEKEQSNE